MLLLRLSGCLKCQSSSQSVFIDTCIRNPVENALGQGANHNAEMYSLIVMALQITIICKCALTCLITRLILML